MDTIFLMAYDNGNYVSKAPAVGPNSPLTGGQAIGAVRAVPGRLSAISVLLCKSVLYGAYMGAQGA
jgi:hypothetical protein